MILYPPPPPFDLPPLPEGGVDVVAGLAYRTPGIVFLFQRAPSTVPDSDRTWATPGGKVEPGESHRDALVREWREETGTEAVVGACLFSFIHRSEGYPKPYRITHYAVDFAGTPAIPPAVGRFDRWTRMDDARDSLPLVPGTRALFLHFTRRHY